MAASFDRLRRLTRDELAHRVAVITRVQRQRLQHAVSAPAWNRASLLSVMAPGLADGDLCDAVERNDWQRATAAIRALLATRRSRFVLDPQSSPALRHAIVSRWPASVADAAERGDALLAGRYDLLGYRELSFAHDGLSIDWHFDPVHQRSAPLRFWADVPYLDSRIGDHKIIWELNRQQHLLALSRAWWLTGDERYRDGIASQITSWMDANPPLIGINWASMLELAFRSLSWLWGMHALLGDDTSLASLDASAWLVDLVIGLDRQLTHVEENLSRYFSPNTHLTGEALALYVAGAALPELTNAARWLDVGREVLLTEVTKQIGRDGGHAERSTHYHRYTLDFYLLALLTAERIGDTEAAAIFGEAALRLAAFMQALVDERGWMPQIGDDDGGMLWPIAGRDPRDARDSLGLAAVVLGRPELAPWGVPEEAFWVGWSARPEVFADAPVAVHDRASLTDRVYAQEFPDTGFVTIRTGRGDHLVLDGGPHGYLNGGHAHADALAITLAIDGAPLLIDPGTATYTMSEELRDRMRSTALHNTLTIDERPSSVSTGPFHWRRRADGQVRAVRENPGFAWAEAQHAGYGDARHRRSIVCSRPGGWLVVDDVIAAGRHSAQLHWHFDPAWRVFCEREGQISVVDDEGRHVWLLHDAGDVSIAFGDDETGLGWCSPRYGLVIPTCTARITRSGDDPFTMLTWIDAAEPLEEAPSLSRIDIDADREAPAIGIAVRRADVTTTTLLRPGDVAQRENRGCSSRDCHSDARLLQYTVGPGVPLSMSLADASHVLALRDEWPSVSADAPFTDLQLSMAGERLEMWSTAPPGRLQVYGSSLWRVTTLRLNGREHRITPASGDHRITVASTDWADVTTSQVFLPCVGLPDLLI